MNTHPHAAKHAAEDKTRKRVAELCGWTGICDGPCGPLGWKGKHEAGEHRTILPDYLNSLDAIAQAEATLTREERVEYAKALHLVVGALEMGEFYALTATARQRVEALLRLKETL